MLFDELDEDELPTVDPTKIKIDIQPRFLEREIFIRLKISDDTNFNNAVKGLEAIKVAFEKEIQILKDAQNGTP